MDNLLEGPCVFCGYNSFGYWQEGTHDSQCPWFFIGSERERKDKLRSVISQVRRDAFLMGARFWEEYFSGGTMWQSDQNTVASEAANRFKEY